MSDFKSFKLDSKHKKKGNTRYLLGMMLGLLLTFGIIFGSEWYYGQIADDLVEQLRGVKELPAGQTLPTYWSREERGNSTLYYTPPTRDVCKILTRPNFELPEGVVKVEANRGSCRHKGGAEVMVFTVENGSTR
jgi:hypothetical protein